MISIITALYNNLELTKQYWTSLQENPPTEQWEIIWVDDCSTDGTREWLASQQYKNCQIILNESNIGFAGSNNLGVKAARGEILCLLNNDTLLTPNWFEPMLGALRTKPRVGIVGNVQVQVTSKLIDHAGMAFDLVGDTIHPSKNLALESLNGAGDFYNSVTAACWLIRKDTFVKNGGFDTSFRNGYEDADLCLRLGEKGYQHWVSYESWIWHHVSASRGKGENVDPNRIEFLKRWGQRTPKLAQNDWPKYYLKRIRQTPTQINLTKFIDALLRWAGLRKGDSHWARKERDAIIRSNPFNRI